MTNRTIGFRCPQELVQQIETRAMTTGKSPTQVVIEILTQALLCPPSLTPQATTPKILLQRLSGLQNQIESIAKCLADSKESTLDVALLTYVESLEKAVNDFRKTLS